MKDPWSLMAATGVAGRMLGLLTLLAMVSGCDLPGKPVKEPTDVPEFETSFSSLFSTNCQACHGADGTLGPGPPLNDGLFQVIVPEEALREVIMRGRAGTLMPAFATEQGGTLTDKQVDALVSGMRSEWFRKAKTDGLPSYAGEAPSGDVDKGKVVFARACASCHGTDGRGGTEGEDPAGSIREPAVLLLMSDQLIRRYIITGRPDLGMPNYASPLGRDKDFQPLTNKEIDDLVSLLASWRQFGG